MYIYARTTAPNKPDSTHTHARSGVPSYTTFPPRTFGVPSEASMTCAEELSALAEPEDSCVYVCMCVCMYVCLDVCMITYIYMYVCVCMYGRIDWWVSQLAKKSV